jgi:hypothetical protein
MGKNIASRETIDEEHSQLNTNPRDPNPDYILGVAVSRRG